MKNQATTAPIPTTKIAISMITSLKKRDVQESDQLDDLPHRNAFTSGLKTRTPPVIKERIRLAEELNTSAVN
jgi:hypothetical protein